MWEPLVLIGNNVGMGMDQIMFWLLFVAFLMVYARDLQIGLMMHMILGLLMSAWYYVMTEDGITGFNYVPPLVIGLIALVLLSLTLMATYKKSESVV